MATTKFDKPVGTEISQINSNMGNLDTSVNTLKNNIKGYTVANGATVNVPFPSAGFLLIQVYDGLLYYVKTSGTTVKMCGGNESGISFSGSGDTFSIINNVGWAISVVAIRA